MRIQWLGIGAGLCLLGAGVAGAAEPTRRGEEAAKHFVVVNADLESAEIHAKMLRELSASDSVYDEATGQKLIEHMKQNLQSARQQLGPIGAMTSGEREKAHFARLEEHTQAAEGQLRELEGRTSDRKAVNKAAGDIKRSLDKGLDPLDDLGEEMRVPVDID